MHQKCQIMLLVLIFELLLLQLYLLYLSINVSVDSFFSWGVLLVSSNDKIRIWNQNSGLDWPKWLLVWTFFDSSTHLLRNLQLRLLSKSELQFILLVVGHCCWTFFFFSPSYSNLGRLRVRKGPVIFLVLLIFKMKILKSYWLEFFREGVAQDFFFSDGFLRKSGLFHIRSFFWRPIDGKWHRVTAPLVGSLLSKITLL